MTKQLQKQEKEKQTYELLVKAREKQGLPLESSSTLDYVSFDDRILRNEKEGWSRNDRLQQSNDSGYEEQCFVEQRWITNLPEREFRIANTYFRNKHEGYESEVDPVYKKLLSNRFLSSMKQHAGSWMVSRYYLGKLRARTITEEEYRFVLTTPITEIYTKTLEKISQMEDLPLEIKLEMSDHTEELTIEPLTLRLANRKTLNSFKDWILADEEFWAEQKPQLEAELARIKGLQGLQPEITKSKKYKFPYSRKYRQDCPFALEDAIRNWCNHETTYVHARHDLETHLSSPSTDQKLSMIPKTTRDYFQDPVYYRIAMLSLYVGSNPKGAKAIERFAERSRNLIITRQMKGKDYDAILNVKTNKEFWDLARKKGRRIPAKQKKVPTKSINISPLTVRLLYNQMRNFVENGGYFPDRDWSRDIVI